MCKKYLLLSSLLAVILARPVAGADFLPDSVQIHGFASQALIATSENNFFGNTEDDVRGDFRELGLNGSWRVFPRLQLSTQWVVRDAGQTDNNNLRMDFLFADYSLVATPETLWGVRLGRVVLPYGLYNDTRDVPFTRPGIFLPQSIYFDVNRQFALSGDGGQIYGEYRTDYGDFLFQFGVFEPRVNDPDLENAITFGFFRGGLTGNPSWISRLIYEKDGGRIRLALSGAQFNAEYQPKNIQPNLEPGAFSFDPTVLSAQYNAEYWSLTSEFALRYARVEDFGPFLPDTSFVGYSWYLQGTYRFAEDWEAVLRYDSLTWDRDDPDGEDFEAATGIPAHRRFARDWTVGLRWDVTPDFMLRAEYHYVDGTGWLSALENDLDDLSRRWSMVSVLASYRW